MINDAVYRQRRGRYTMDLWERALCRWVEIDNPFNVRHVFKKPGQQDKEFIWTPAEYLPDPTPESQEMVVKALAQAILDQLVMCSSFKYNMVVKDRRDDRSGKLSSLVKIPNKVKKLLGMMSMAAEGTEEEEELVLWGGEVMELGQAERKDFELWKKQPEEKKQRWGDRSKESYFVKAEKEKENNRPIIRRVLSG